MRTSYCLLLVVLLLGCVPPRQPDWRVSLDADDARPYGTKLLAQGLPHWFGEARTERLSSGFRYDDLAGKLYSEDGGKAALVLFGLQFFVAQEEWEALQEWASEGNDVVVFASTWDPRLLEYLQLETAQNGPVESDPADSLTTELLRGQAVWLEAAPAVRYTYRGRSLLRTFRYTTDEPVPDPDDFTYAAPQVIGRGSNGITSLRYRIGDGSLTVHTAPLVLSNYFLLQPQNRQYLDRFWQAAVPQPVATVYWQDYYKRVAEHNGWGVLWRSPAARWALLLALFTALLYILFESKRRQRVIPIVAPPENTSVLFAETIGRLYYSQGNHQNLAEKMVQQTLDAVRTRYNLSTDVLDAGFTEALAQKAGVPLTIAQSAVAWCDAIRTDARSVSESDLHLLHQALRPILHPTS